MVLKLLVLCFGLLLTGYTLFSAVRTFVLPRGERDSLSASIFTISRYIFNIRLRKANSFEQRDRILALFAPITLLFVPIIWVVLIIIGYACIYWAVGITPWQKAIELSGSSLLTLGTTPFIAPPITLIEFTEATIGLGIVALLIAYLPTMYSAFSQREAQVTMLAIRAGTPPTATELILRMHRNSGLNHAYLAAFWAEWEMWFTQLEESHSSLAALIFFRSPRSDRSWVTAAGAVLDAASLIDSTVDVPIDFQRRITIRAGFLALRSIADVFNIPHDPDPNPDDLISITQDEFDEVYNQLKSGGVPVLEDRQRAWENFRGWRVNYDRVLLRLAALVLAPYAPWISDRSVPQYYSDDRKSSAQAFLNQDQA